MTATRQNRPPVTTEDQAVVLVIRPQSLLPEDVTAQVWRWVPAASQWLLVSERALDGSLPASANVGWDELLQVLYNAGWQVADAATCPF